MDWCGSSQEDALSSTGTMWHTKCLALWPHGLYPMAYTLPSDWV